MVLWYEGWNIIIVGDGLLVIVVVCCQWFDVVVFDVMLFDMSGFDVLYKLCSENLGLLVLLLMVKDVVEDCIVGLIVGGDDYVIKLFSIEEVVFWLWVLLCCMGVMIVDSGVQLVVGDLVLDEDSYEVMCVGELVLLMFIEFELLWFMMYNFKWVLSKVQILDCVWSYDFGGWFNIVELYILYLCKKIDNGCEFMIYMLCGVGYVFKLVCQQFVNLVVLVVVFGWIGCCFCCGVCGNYCGN